MLWSSRGYRSALNTAAVATTFLNMFLLLHCERKVTQNVPNDLNPPKTLRAPSDQNLLGTAVAMISGLSNGLPNGFPAVLPIAHIARARCNSHRRAHDKDAGNEPGLIWAQGATEVMRHGDERNIGTIMKTPRRHCGSRKVRGSLKEPELE